MDTKYLLSNGEYTNSLVEKKINELECQLNDAIGDYKDMEMCFDNTFIDKDYIIGFEYAEKIRKEGGYNYSHLNIFQELKCYYDNKIKELENIIEEQNEIIEQLD